MISLLLQWSFDPTSIVSPNHPCQRVLIPHLLLLLNFSEVMLLLPALCMKTTAGKRSFAPIVKEKATKRRNVGRNPAMLSNTKGPGPIQLEQKLLWWMSLVRIIVRWKRKTLLADNDSWWFLWDKKYRPSWIPQVISILFKKTLRTIFVSSLSFLQKPQHKLAVYSQDLLGLPWTVADYRLIWRTSWRPSPSNLS